MKLTKILKRIYKYRKTARFFTRYSNYATIYNDYIQYLEMYL